MQIQGFYTYLFMNYVVLVGMPGRTGSKNEQKRSWINGLSFVGMPDRTGSKNEQKRSWINGLSFVGMPGRTGSKNEQEIFSDSPRFSAEEKRKFLFYVEYMF